jgi:hypothetical protein
MRVRWFDLGHNDRRLPAPATGEPPTTEGITPVDLGPITGTINNLLTIASGLGILLCAFFLCAAGFYFMTSAGNPGAIERSKSAAFNAAIGFALVLSARVIANLINGAVVR